MVVRKTFFDLVGNDLQCHERPGTEYFSDGEVENIRSGSSRRVNLHPHERREEGSDARSGTLERHVSDISAVSGGAEGSGDGDAGRGCSGDSASAAEGTPSALEGSPDWSRFTRNTFLHFPELVPCGEENARCCQSDSEPYTCGHITTSTRRATPTASETTQLRESSSGEAPEIKAAKVAEVTGKEAVSARGGDGASDAADPVTAEAAPEVTGKEKVSAGGGDAPSDAADPVTEEAAPEVTKEEVSAVGEADVSGAADSVIEEAAPEVTGEEEVSAGGGGAPSDAADPVIEEAALDGVRNNVNFTSDLAFFRAKVNDAEFIPPFMRRQKTQRLI